jgi:DNA-damage-inducible protein J
MEHDAGFRAKVFEGLEDTRPDISGEDVEAHFARRRVAALSKIPERLYLRSIEDSLGKE